MPLKILKQDSEAGTHPPSDEDAVFLDQVHSPNSQAEVLQHRERRFRNLYKRPPDFKALAKLDPGFAHFVKGRDLDFHDPAAVLQLTKTLLKLDFDVEIELPESRLCPPVPNRHNYILWIKDLLDTTISEDPARHAVGLDIGTGASCIYPLLGCAQRPWSFIATDVDAESLSFAQRNINLNSLSNRITLLARQPTDPLIPANDLPPTLDFLMTNPPFYSSADELLASASKKSLPPSTACTGALTEMVTPGGEVGFVTRIIEESLALKDRVAWYTAMVGFLSSLTALVDKLKKEGVMNYAVTEFVRGGKTRRWAVAWSFGRRRPPEGVSRGIGTSSISKNVLPPSTEARLFERVPVEDLGPFVAALIEKIAELDLTWWEWDSQALEGIGHAPDKVWGRAWRRMKKRQDGGWRLRDSDSPCEKSLGFKVAVRVRRQDVAVLCLWVEGFDATVFESFTGFLKACIDSIRGGGT